MASPSLGGLPVIASARDEMPSRSHCSALAKVTASHCESLRLELLEVCMPSSPESPHAARQRHVRAGTNA